MQARIVAPSAYLRAGLVAGVAGSLLIGAYLVVTVVYLFHAATLETFFRYIASAALGKAAYTVPHAVTLGIVLHLAIGIGWTIGYAYMATQTPQVRARPLTSGIVFGIFVMIAMQLGEVLANIYTLPNSFTLLNDFIAHIVFFGIPVAYIVKRFEPV